MKKTLFSLVIILIGFCTTLQAQTKTGTIDIELLLMNMPEIESVQQNLKDYGTSLDDQLNDKMTDYQTKLDNYNTNVESFTETQIQEKQAEIYALEEDITKFRQNGMQLIRIREDELKRPLYQKIAAALEKIAKADGYTQILTTNDGSDVVYLDPDFDITLKVATELDLEIED